MIARGPGVIPSLDGVRTFAVLAVFAAHADLLPISPGPLGVSVFFFLSGYLITTLLRIEHERSSTISLRQFYMRRIFRIFPPMYLVLLVSVILTAFGVAGTTLDVRSMLAVGAFYVNYFEAFGANVPLPLGTGQFWSLAVEEHFYLLFPILYLILLRFTPSRRRQLAILAALAAAVLVWRTYLVFAAPTETTYRRIYYGTDTRADAILLGALLAIGWNPQLDPLNISERIATWALLPGGVMLMLGAAALPDAINRSVGFTAISVGCAMVFVAIIKYPQSWAGRILNWPPIAYIGLLSYSMYLLQGGVLQILKATLRLPQLAYFGLDVLLSVVLALAIRHAVERPFARLRKRLATTRASATHDQHVASLRGL